MDAPFDTNNKFMNEEPKPLLQRSWTTPRWLRVWLKLVAILFPVSMLVAWGVNGFKAEWWSWPPQVLLWFVFSGILAGVLVILWGLFRWCCVWHNLRRVLFVVVSVTTVIALYYAVTDWRGQHAWDQYRRAHEALGQHFDVPSVMPPAVPDDQNFALTPLVFSTYGQMIDRTGHEIQPRNTNLVNRLRMDLYGGGNWPSNCPGHWATGTLTDLGALQTFYRERAMKTNEFPMHAQPQSPAADVLLALSPYNATIEELREDARLPLCRFPLEYDKDNPAAILLPHLAAMKQASQLLQIRALAELADGQSVRALADVQLIFRLTEALRSEPVFISHLVRQAMLQIALQPIWEGMANRQWSEPQLAALEAALAGLDFGVDFRTGMRGEIGFQGSMRSYLQRHPQTYDTFLDGNWGLDPLPTSSSSREGLMILLMHAHLVPAGWFFESQLKSVQITEDYYLPLADVTNHLFSPQLAGQGDALSTNGWRTGQPDRILADIMLPALGGGARRFAYGQSSVDLARVAIALERYYGAQGHYPETLDPLAPQWLDKIPHDVIGGQPLHYRRTDDGRFVLYSVGWNEKDDGGVVVYETGSAPGQKISEGDWVWRYPQK